MVKWHVLGAGAIGQLVAHHLRKQGADVVLLLRSASALDTFRDGGGSIRVERPVPKIWEDIIWDRTTEYADDASREPLPGIVTTTLTPRMEGESEQMLLAERSVGFQVEVVADAGEHRASTSRQQSRIDNLLVTVKAHQTVPALMGLRHRLCADSNVVLLQNGMGVKEEIECQLGGNVDVPGPTVITAITTHGCNRSPDRPFHIQHNTLYGEGRLLFGFTEGRSTVGSGSTLRCLESLQQLDELGAVLMESKGLRSAQQMKLMANCCINPLTALLRCRNGALLTSEETRTIMYDVCREGAAAFTVMGPEPVSADSAYQAAVDVARSTENNVSSMLQDMRNSRETEVEYMNGFLCRMSRDLDLLSPVNDMLSQLVRAKTILPPSP